MTLKDQKGQFLIESVLLMILMMVFITSFVKIFRGNQILTKIVEAPWQRTAGMIEAGVWGPPAQTKTKVPYQYDRFHTPDAN